jgi:hypothetical protein
MPIKPTSAGNREYTDAQGEKWVQTSTEDIFALKELNEIIASIEHEKDRGEIVLAKIDFRTVNKEYYDSIQTLQTELKHKDELLKKLAVEAKRVIKRKNDKMIEMIRYIKQLQLLVAYNNLDRESLEKINIDPAALLSARKQEEQEETVEYEDVAEIALTADGEEIHSI